VIEAAKAKDKKMQDEKAQDVKTQDANAHDVQRKGKAGGWQSPAGTFFAANPTAALS